MTTLQLRDGMVVHDLSGASGRKGAKPVTQVVEGDPVRLPRSPVDVVVHFVGHPDEHPVYGVQHRWALVA